MDEQEDTDDKEEETEEGKKVVERMESKQQSDVLDWEKGNLEVVEEEEQEGEKQSDERHDVDEKKVPVMRRAEGDSDHSKVMIERMKGKKVFGYMVALTKCEVMGAYHLNA